MSPEPTHQPVPQSWCLHDALAGYCKHATIEYIISAWSMALSSTRDTTDPARNEFLLGRIKKTEEKIYLICEEVVFDFIGGYQVEYSVVGTRGYRFCVLGDVIDPAGPERTEFVGTAFIASDTSVPEEVRLKELRKFAKNLQGFLHLDVTDLPLGLECIGKD